MIKWWRRVRGDEVERGRELTRSQYSLVSSSELTPGALRAWALLPPEVKYDSSLEPFKQLYEQEHGITDTIVLNGFDTRFQRLPLVHSAPLLSDNLTLSPEKLLDNGPGKTMDKTIDAEKLEKNSDTPDQLYPGNDENTKVTLFNILKICFLVTCWIFFTVIFMMYNEKEEIVRHTLVAPGDNKSYILNVSDSTLSVLVQLSGPFLSEQMETKLNSSQIQASAKVNVWLEQWSYQNESIRQLDHVPYEQGRKISSPWTLVLQTENLDFSQGEKRSGLISLASDNSTLPATYALRMSTTADQTVPLTVSYTLNPLDMSTGVIYALLLLLGLYGIIIFEIINRTMAALLVSTTSLAVLAMVGERPSLQELVSWLDMETLLLLFSMMVLVAIMAETGMFDFLAVYTFQVTRGKIWPLINLLCAITALLSTVLDNVTTVLLMAPVTIRLCEVTNLNPVPILMAMVVYSNIGGTATPVGDPPNVIIASNKVVIQSGINFTNFTLHMSLGILLVCVQTYLQLRYWHIDVHRLRHSEPRDIQEMRHQLTTWRRAAQSLPHVSSDERVVRLRLEQKIDKITKELTKKLREKNSRACDETVFHTTLNELKDKYKIRDKKLLIKASVALLFVISVFFLHAIPELNRVSLAWTALLGVILLLILADRDDLEPILHRVEWSTLLFFAALFVLMEALSKLGLIEFIGDLTESIILRVNENARLAVSLLLMLWVSGISSAFIDNIPLTTMMIRVVTTLGSKQSLGLPMAPLIWALSFGACLGGNGTLIGASANVLCAGVAEQHGYKFTFMQFFKIGFPVMIGHLIVASGYLLLCHCVFSWH